MKKTKIILIAASAAMMLTGCMSREETELLSVWTMERYTAQAMAVQERATWREKLEDTQTDKPEIVKIAEPAAAHVYEPIREQAGSEPEEAKPRETEPQPPLPVMDMASSPAASESTPMPAAKAENAPAPVEPTPIPKNEWPYITCPPEPTPIPQSEWPYITCPPEPILTPQPEWPESPAPTEPEPTPTPTATPTEPDLTPAPTPEPGPVETPPAMPEPTPTPAGGYAVCSCGATLTPDELIPHMKAHAMNGEGHSYRAY